MTFIRKIMAPVGLGLGGAAAFFAALLLFHSATMAIVLSALTVPLLAGVVTLTWEWPLNPSPGPGPTALQTAYQSQQVVHVLTDGVATSVVITHNLNISTADLANHFPKVTLIPRSQAAADGTLAPWVSALAANTITITFLAVVGNFDVVIDRPYNSIR